MTLHEEVLPTGQRAVLRRLGQIVTGKGFYLGGGTAVAIHAGHRLSLDFGWFTEARFPDPVVLAAWLREFGAGLEIESTDAGTLHARCDGFPVSFLEYAYPLLSERVPWPAYGGQLASVQDLACMKLAAVSSRGLKKDFVDVFAILRAGNSLAEVLDLYRRKYAVSDVGHVVTSLTYFDDADPEEMPRMLWQVSWDEVKDSIKAWVVDFVRRAP